MGLNQVSEPIHIISLGAGVQSSTMALMASDGEIEPRPSCAIFADTGDEPDAVYEWLGRLETIVDIPVIRVAGPILRDHLINRHGTSRVPSWIDTKIGPKMGHRNCTNDFKVRPLRREIRRRYPAQSITLWIGISLDEVSRMKPSEMDWLTHTWPLIDKRMTRQDCQLYLQRRGLKAPKSSCIYCPFKSGVQWRETQSTTSPRELEILRYVEGQLNPRGEFLTSQLKPLFESDFRTDEDHGQLTLFNAECQGMCGV